MNNFLTSVTKNTYTLKKKKNISFLSVNIHFLNNFLNSNYKYIKEEYLKYLHYYDDET